MFSRDVEYNRLERAIVKIVHGYNNLFDCMNSSAENQNLLVSYLKRLLQFPAAFASEALFYTLDLPLSSDEMSSINISNHRGLLESLSAWRKIAYAIHKPEKFNQLANCLHREVDLSTKEDLRFIITRPDIKDLVLFAYLSNDEKIIALFKKYFTVPKAAAFEGYTVPDYIRKAEAKSLSVIRELTHDDIDKTRKLEQSAITIQRFFRAHQRRREERIRMSPDENADQVMLDASQPYIPKKCRADLAIRIVRAASKVVLFHSIYHYTDRVHLTSIFDDGLYGRRSLLQHYMPFKPSSLCSVDISNGDENIICFAPNYVDTNALDKGVQIEIDMSRLDMTNPCILYKQADLCFYYYKERVVQLGEIQIRFAHTGPKGRGCISMQLLQGQGIYQNVLGVAHVNNNSLISYNRAQMHQVLILNFFRFLDALTSCNHPKSIKRFVDDVYNRIDALTDAELAKFLLDIGKNISDTAEFNFYGAHLIDFDSLTAIRLYKKELANNADVKIKPYYIFNLPELVKDLQRGDLTSYRELQENLPEVARSYRLHDYLLTKVIHPQSVIELQRHRNRCESPAYLANRF